MINPEHEQAQELSSRAALLLQKSKKAEARRLFARAARMEKQALAKIPSDKARTRGILSVSFAALLIKAENYREAREELPKLLEDATLSPSSRRQIEDLLEEARQKDQDAFPFDRPAEFPPAQHWSAARKPKS